MKFFIFSFLVLANIFFVYMTFIHVAFPDLPQSVNASTLTGVAEGAQDWSDHLKITLI